MLHIARALERQQIAVRGTIDDAEEIFFKYQKFSNKKERVLELEENTDKTGLGQAKDILQSLDSKIGSRDGLVYQSQEAQKCLQTLIGHSILHSLSTSPV